MTDKKCRDCGQLKPLSEFPPNTRNRDGRATYCRPCMSARHREYRRRTAQREGREIRIRRAAPVGTKWCPRCKQLLPLDAFGRNRSARDGLVGYCKPCHKAKTRATRQRLYGGSREYHLRRRYGIGEADFVAMLEQQGGLCAACRVDKPVHVDHDHKTGLVRGLLCYLCNQALGNVRDDSERLQGLIDYLERAAARQLELKVETYEPCACHVFEIAGAALHRAA